jgi:hypothetical protein
MANHQLVTTSGCAAMVYQNINIFLDAGLYSSALVTKPMV